MSQGLLLPGALRAMVYRIVPGLLIVAVGACQRPAADTTSGAGTSAPPHVMATSDVDAGRYLVIVGGCNDCHTEGFLQSQGDVPEEQWLAGSRIGWRGPWGTTYPRNLRLRAQEWSEDTFVQTLHQRNSLPPMPWMDVNQISENDARAIYRYIRSLGPFGDSVPKPVPPDQEPTTPYISLIPVQPGTGTAGGPGGAR